MLFTLLGCTLSARCNTNSLLLAKGSETDYVIYISPDAAQTSRNAAQELSTFLKQITQATFPIVESVTNGAHVIAVGPLAAKTVAPQLDLSKTGDTGLGDDGIVIKVIDSHHLVLTGAEGAKRGTLYSVYEFLEREVGVRWWTENASFVPNTPDLSITVLDIRYRPVFDYREALYRYLQGLPATKGMAAVENRAKFMVRERFNGHFARIPAEWGGSYSLLGWCHTFYQLMPPDKYFNEHPEWYSEINGKRVHHAGAQLCCTDDSMIAELTSNVLKRIRANPDAGIISVSQNDSGGGYCECARCKTMDDAEGSHAGSLLYCVNKVAEAVEKEFPEFKVETLAYIYTRKPPKTIRPRKNVLIRLAVIGRSSGQPIDSAINHAIMEDLQTWKAVAPNLFIWDYVASQTAGYTPNPSLHVYAPDLRTYAENNVRGVFFQGNYTKALGSFDQLKTYVMSHAMWNPYLDEDDIIDDFLNGYYGVAAPFLRQYLDLLATKGICIPAGKNWSTPLDAEWMDLATMNEATTLFNEAERVVVGDPTWLKRVRYARLGIDHQWLRGYQRYRDEGGTFNGPTDLPAALEDFLERAKEAADGEIISMVYTVDYEAALRDHVDAILHPAAVPEALSDIPADRIIDFQPHQFFLDPRAAQIVSDAAASGGKAVEIDPRQRTWAAQAKDLNEHGIDPGLYRIYGRIRCEKTSDFGDNTERGKAFTGSVYNPNGVGASLSTRLERTGEWSPNAPIVQLSQGGAVDGQYHLYDLGAHDLKPGARVWFGTAGLVPAECVKAVYIDRLIFVKE